MILPDYIIRKEIVQGRIVVDPLPDWETALQPCSQDLRLGSLFQLQLPGAEVFDPRTGQASDYLFETEIFPGDWLVLHPGRAVLGTTLERVGLPADLRGNVNGRSSIGRLFLTSHVTAGYIDPGFLGQITLEICNLGQCAVRLHPGMRICQIEFARLEAPCRRPYGHLDRQSKYQEQQGAVGSRVHLDVENR